MNTMKKHLLRTALLAALLPVLAVLWARFDQCSERKADAALLMCIHELKSETGEERKIAELREWLSSHSTHPLAAVIKKGFWWYDSDAHPNTAGMRRSQLESHLHLAESMIAATQ